MIELRQHVDALQMCVLILMCYAWGWHGVWIYVVGGSVGMLVNHYGRVLGRRLGAWLHRRYPW